MSQKYPINQARNGILASLGSADQTVLQRYLEPVELPIRERLQTPHRAIKSAYFLESGVASVVAITGGQRRTAEVALIGHEGMSGLAVVLGADSSPNEVFMQVAGTAQRIGTDDLRGAMSESKTLSTSLTRYASCFAVQLAQTAVANAQGTIEERLARWLLMAHDRVLGSPIAITHDFLAMMLGVRRAGITMALHALEARNLILTSRGSVIVRDRSGLHRQANGLYGIPEAEYARLFPPSS